MRARLALSAVIALSVLALIAVACGRGEGGEAAIRTEGGLAVAARLGGEGLAGDTLVPRQGLPAAGPAAGQGGVVGEGVTAVGEPGAAPFFLRAQQQGQTGITVQGFGSATAQADRAVLELFFGSEAVSRVKPMPEPAPGFPEGETAPEMPSPPPEVTPITEDDLQPVIEAIVAQGVDRDDIEVLTEFYDPYFSSATVRVTVGDVAAVDGIVEAARTAAEGLEEIGLQSTSVLYTVSDCLALERAAMRAAVDDAGQRAAAFAQVLGVGLGPVVGASTYSYSPFGGGPCEPDLGGPYPLSRPPYARGQSPQVQLIAIVSVTYAVQ